MEIAVNYVSEQQPCDRDAMVTMETKWIPQVLQMNTIRSGPLNVKVKVRV